MTEGVIGLGTLLKFGDGGDPEAFTAIAEVKDITGPGLSREFAEFTTSSPPGAAGNTSRLSKIPATSPSSATFCLTTRHKVSRRRGY